MQRGRWQADATPYHGLRHACSDPGFPVIEVIHSIALPARKTISSQE